MKVSRKLAWGARVEEAFALRVVQICEGLGFDPSWLMAVMAFETGESFSASVRNAAGSGATGLIQFMPQTAAAMGTSVEALARLTPLKQLDFVEAYFWPRRGKLGSLEDVYMAVLWPAAIRKPLDFVLFEKGSVKNPRAYVQNVGLDYDKNGRITKREAARRVKLKLEKGLREGYSRVY